LQNDAAGVLFRINVGKKAAFLLDADYLSTKPEFQDFGFLEKHWTIETNSARAQRKQNIVFSHSG
jgi:hypothetical protein